jgi:Stress up-regulated Nod 19
VKALGIVRRTGAIGALVGAVALVAAGCVPLKNAPPGGGTIVTQTFRYGPFTLGPGGEVMGSPSSGMPRPDGAFGLKSAKFDVVDAAGNPVSVHDVHLHHIVMTTSARQDQLCPGRPERFIGAGMERTPIDLWGPYTYLVGASDQWGSIYHLMNETPPGTPAKTVYIQYTLGYQPGANATNSRPLDVYFQDVTGCGGSTYDVPGNGGPGSVHTKSRSWTAPREGIAVFTGGHLHEGGIDITLDNTTTNEKFCTGTATYHENPRHLSAINACALHHQIFAGNNLRVTARYDNSQPWQDVMGIMLTYVWWGTQ